MEKINSLARYVHPVRGRSTDFDALLDAIGESSVVLLGEATHGTHEFYAARAAISQQLIEKKGFGTILFEADWPDMFRVNNYINDRGPDRSARESLIEFKRFPAWMWRNEEFVSFIEWLRSYNQKLLEPQSPVHVYGLDLYSLHRSIEVVIHELEKIDAHAAQKARERYACFDAYADPQEYGYIASSVPGKSCHDIAVEQLLDIKTKQFEFFKDDLDPVEEKLYVEQNALIVKNAERYYRSLFGNDAAASWNIRDTHMMETINAIVHFNQVNQRHHKIIVWAHNSHLGDARATQMASYNEINVGQLVKEAFGAQAFSVGFTTYSGRVAAASSWGADVEHKKVMPALANSIEAFFHESGVANFVLILAQYPEVYALFNHDDYVQRAIGVIYRPQTERQSHYFYAQLAKQFDAIIHYDESSAVTPLEKSTAWHSGQDAPETYPFGV